MEPLHRRHGALSSQRWDTAIRLVAVATGVAAVGCLSWTTATGPHAKDHYVWDWQEVPWDLLPVSNIACARLSSEALMAQSLAAWVIYHLERDQPLRLVIWSVSTSWCYSRTRSFPLDRFDCGRSNRNHERNPNPPVESGTILQRCPIWTWWILYAWGKERRWLSLGTSQECDDMLRLRQLHRAGYLYWLDTPSGRFRTGGLRFHMGSCVRFTRTCLESFQTDQPFYISVCHFVLFVRACITTHRYKKRKRSTRTDALTQKPRPGGTEKSQPMPARYA